MCSLLTKAIVTFAAFTPSPSSTVRAASLTSLEIEGVFVRVGDGDADHVGIIGELRILPFSTFFTPREKTVF